MIPVNASIGRMQPFTTGHLKLAEETYKRTHLKTVYFIIDTTKADHFHPFLTKMMWPAFKAIAKSNEAVEDFILVNNANIIRMAEAAAAKGYTISSLTCGTDRFADYQRMCSKYAPDVKVLEVHRTDKDVSATEVRNAIREGDEERFKELTPESVHKLYWKLKKALDEVDEMPAPKNKH